MKIKISNLVGVTVMSVAVLTGCSSAQNQETLKEPISQERVDETKLSVMDQYQELLDSAMLADEIYDSIRKNVGSVSMEEADTMIRGLIGYYGNPQKVDYTKITEYQNYLSDEMNNFIHLFMIENEKPYKDENGIAITLGDFLERTVQAESFITMYSNSPLYNYAYNYYCELIDSAITGGYNKQNDANNFYMNIEQDRIDGHAISIYRSFVNEYKDTVTADVIGQYLTKLEESNNKIDKNIEAFYIHWNVVRDFPK